MPTRDSLDWLLSYRDDPVARSIADRHYNRQNPGASGFVPPGRCLVLIMKGSAPSCGSLWVTSWPYAQYVKHQWAGAWMNSCFRRESGPLASDLIRQAVAVTRWRWPDIPPLGMVTFIDHSKVRHKRDVGRSYRKAGFKVIGETKAGLLAFGLAPNDMPEPESPFEEQLPLTF